MISAFKHIRLSGYNVTPVQGTAYDNSSALRLGFQGSGLAYYSELTGISGYLQGLIDTANADVSSILAATGDGLSYTAQGAVRLTGTDGITINVDAANNEIRIVGNSGYFQGLVNDLSYNLASTGSTLVANLASTGSTLATNLASTGSTLATNLASTGSTLVTNLASTGSTLATNLASTGSTLNIKVDNLSGYVNATFVKKVNQQVFSVGVPQGIESTGILFPVEFSSIPSTVNVTLETAGDVMYMVGVRSKSTSGYFADFSDVVQENTVRLNTFASNQPV